MQNSGHMMRRPFMSAVTITLLTLAGMILFQVAKRLVYPGITLNQSNAITVVVGALLAGSFSLLALRRRAVDMERLRESESRFRIVAENTHDWEYWIDETGRVLYSSPSCERITGINAEAFLSDQNLLMRHIHPEDLELVRQHQRSVHQPQSFGALEFRIIRPDQTIRWIGHTCQAVYDDRGRFRGIRGSNRDITERKNAELLLASSEALYQKLAECSPDVIFLCDRDMRIQYLNQAGESLVGLGRADLLGKRLADLISQDFEARHRESVLLAFRTQRPVSGELQVELGGRALWLSVRLSPIASAKGEIESLLGIAQDITQYKRLTTALAQSEEKYRHVVDHAGIGVALVDRNFRVLAINRQLRAWYPQLKEGDLSLGAQLFSVQFPSDLADSAPTVKAYADGKVHEASLTTTRDDQAVNYRLVATPIRDENGVITSSVELLEDVTGRISMDKKIQQVAENEKRKLGHDLHDGLGQHLAGIEFSAKALESRLMLLGLPEATQAARLTHLINQAVVQTRDLSRMLVPVEPEDDGLRTALDHLAGYLSRQVGVDCRLICPGEARIHDHFAATQLFRIAQESTTNAIKHGKAGRLTISLSSAEGKTTLSITDNGRGLPKDWEDSHGFGLKLMHRRAQSIRGNLDVRSRPGEGTTISCTWKESL